MFVDLNFIFVWNGDKDISVIFFYSCGCFWVVNINICFFYKWCSYDKED